jgi:hypothetical protein
MICKPLAGERSKRFDKVQIVMSGEDGHMSQVGCQKGQFRFQIRTLPVPAKQGVYSEAVTPVMDSGQYSLGGTNRASVQENGETPLQSGSSIGPTSTDPVPDQRRLRGHGQAVLAPSLEVVLDLLDYIRVKGQQSRLVELGGSDEKGALLRVIIADGEPKQFTASETCGVEKHQGETNNLGAEWRRIDPGQVRTGGQEASGLRFGKDVRLDRLVRGWEEGAVRHKAVWLGAAAIKAQIADNAHLASSYRGAESFFHPAPFQEAFGGKVLITVARIGEELIERRQNPLFVGVKASQGSVQGQITLDRRGQGGGENDVHERTSA